MKILFYSPYSAIWEHSFPEALIADMLKVEENTITYITCGEVFQEYCIPMNAVGLNTMSDIKDKLAVCKQCQINKNLIKQRFALNSYDLNDILLDVNYQEIKLLLSQITQENFHDFKIDDIEIGQIALFDLLLVRKKISLEFTDDEWKFYLISLKNCLVSFFGYKKILLLEKPDRVLMYNTLYSINQIARKLSEKNKIPAYFLHAGENISNRLSTMMIARGVTFDYRKELIAHWPTYRGQCFTEQEYEKITDHFLGVISGKHFLTYSSAKDKKIFDLYSRFNIPKNVKILTATMSSYDERFAAETVGALPMYSDLIFPLQADWIHSLIDYVADRNDLFLIIRVHPREFPNKRDNVKSEHAAQLEGLFNMLPGNVAVNWPTDDISLYDLAQETDVFLNAWSGVGEEMTLLGIPVVIYSDDLVLYPSDLNYLGHDKHDYFKKIEQALTDGWRFEHIRNAYRWYILRFSGAVINFQSSYDPKKRPFILEFINKVFNKLRLLSQNYLIKTYDCQTHNAFKKEDASLLNKLLNNQSNTLLDLKEPEKLPITIQEETTLIKREIKRLYNAMYGSSKNTINSGKLRYNFKNMIEERR